MGAGRAGAASDAPERLPSSSSVYKAIARLFWKHGTVLISTGSLPVQILTQLK